MSSIENNNLNSNIVDDFNKFHEITDSQGFKIMSYVAANHKYKEHGSLYNKDIIGTNLSIAMSALTNTLLVKLKDEKKVEIKNNKLVLVK